MSYRLEGKDIVLAGFDEGIAENPYKGIADMRNMEIISVPGEASVAFSMSAITLPPVMNAVAYTAQNTGDTLTVASTTGMYNGMAITLNTNTATGLSTGIVYYVGNITATTFQLWLMPALQGAAVAVTADGSGTFTSYQYGNQRGNSGTAYAPVSYFSVSIFQPNPGNPMGAGLLFTDWSNYVWFMPRSGSGVNKLFFLGNIGGNGASSLSVSSVAFWNNYVFTIGSTSFDVADITSLWFTDGPAIAWDYGWNAANGHANSNVNGRGPVLVSQEDGNLYWGTNRGVSSLILTPGDTFDSTDTASYTLNEPALPITPTDRVTCMTELGPNLLIGTTSAYIYVWDKISLGFNNLLNIPDPYTSVLVATSQNAYAFSGARGKIYITNGSGIELYKKVPDYVTGVVSPYIRWRSAYVDRNQLYFSFNATDNAGTALTTVAGAWAIDLETDALRLINKITNTGYSGITSMVTGVVPGTQLNVPSGTGLINGWTVGTTYGIDIPATTPYVNYESYVETDMIPVGSYLDVFTGSQVEWKTSSPLGANGTAETIRIYYRTNINSAFTLLGTSTAIGTTMVGSDTGTTANANTVSDYYKVNFEKAQWVQFRVESSSNATTPTYNRLTEIRVRDWPSGSYVKQ